jgi:hypothetical protein
MEAYPAFTTPAQAQRCIAFPGGQMTKAGTSGRSGQVLTDQALVDHYLTKALRWREAAAAAGGHAMTLSPSVTKSREPPGRRSHRYVASDI